MTAADRRVSSVFAGKKSTWQPQEISGVGS